MALQAETGGAVRVEVDSGVGVGVGVGVDVIAGAGVGVRVSVGVGVAVTETVLLHELADISKVSNSATTSALHRTFLILFSQ
jgi:phosphotransferase system IIA component